MFNSVFSAGITAQGFFITMGTAVVLGIIMAMVLLIKSRHTSSFALTLAVLPMAVTLVIMMVNGNIGAGVAVAGAFALVRFRSVPGTAREIAAIFIQMTIGLVLGMGYVVVAIMFAVMAAVVVAALALTNFGGMNRTQKVLKITMPENYNFEGMFDDLFDKYTKSVSLDKVKTTNMGTLYELTYVIELASNNVPKAFLDEIRTRNGNLNVSIGNISDELSL